MPLILALLFALPVLAEYAEVRGVRMYYEVHGAGRPVVFLHGGMNSIRTSFSKQIPVFARNHRVIAIDQMAHGRTADVAGRKLTYEDMAEDTAALLKKINITNADFVGWSDGGQLALRLAFTHPGLVRRVVASGVGFGPTPEILKEINSEKDFPKLAATMFPAGYEDYKRVSPNGPAHWSVYAEKGKIMWTGATWGFTAKDLERIQRPVLIVAGDADAISIEATTHLFRVIPQAKLYIVPGTGHTTFQDRPEWLNPVILHFLDQN